MNRRGFVRGGLAVVGLGALAGCEAARPPWQASRTPRVGVLGERSPEDPFVTAFRQGLRELGYEEGRSIALEYRYAYAAVERFSQLAAELIDLGVDVLVTGGLNAVQAARGRSTTVPIVFALVGDPVGLGLAASLARPGGNATGLSSLSPGLHAKQIEILAAAIPGLARVGVPYNPTSPVAAPALGEMREAARGRGAEVLPVEVREPGELPAAFMALAGRGADAVLPFSDPVLGNQLAQIARLAVEHRLPSIFLRREFPDAGGLMAYGPNFPDNWRRAAAYVDRILKGAKPGDLPIEQPTRFDFVLNLKTAKALGRDVPPAVLAQATEVIR